MSENLAARTEATTSPRRAPVGAPARAMIEASGIVKRWPKRPAPVLDGVDLTVPEGRFVGLTGRNGAGKTTFLRIMAAIIEPEAGEVRIDGLDPHHQRGAFNRRIGFLSAGHSGLFARLTVRQHLEYWGRLALMPSDARRPAITRVTSAFDIGDLLAQRVDRLSAGQRQRVRLALTFLHEPRVVLLDEPRNSLDTEAAALLLDEIERFTRSGGSVVWCAPTDDGIDSRVDDHYTLADGSLVRR